MKFILNTFIVIFILADSVFSQPTNKPDVRMFIEVPREAILQVVANQPGCPIRFEDLKLFASISETGGFGLTNSYNLRNIGKKSIVNVTTYSTNGAENTYGINKFRKTPIKSGELFPKGPPNPNLIDKIIPLTDELRNKYNLNRKMIQPVVVLMVVSVEFADGTKYSDEATYKALQEHTEEVVNALYEFRKKKQKP